MTDPVKLTQDLIRCASVTPKDEGAIPLLDALLTEAGFTTQRIDRGGIANLFAKWGSGKTIGFNGHTDVVPPGDPSDWTEITGDEEGIATDGTTAILDWMTKHNQTMDVCLVGEPTCPSEMGDMMKIGRRGSMTAHLTATGIQGHVAYPHSANNPLPVLVYALNRMASHKLDEGTAHFDPSTLAITTIDTGNPANNVIPAEAKATVNIRFNDAHNSKDLSDWINTQCAEAAEATGVTISTDIKVSGESFFTEPGPFSESIARAVEAETGRRPEASTSGGTSDARFIKDHCPVVEFGLVGKTMHQANESVPVAQIHQLKAIYTRIITDFLTQEA